MLNLIVAIFCALVASLEWAAYANGDSSMLPWAISMSALVVINLVLAAVFLSN